MIVIFVVAMLFLGIRPSSRKQVRAKIAARNKRKEAAAGGGGGGGANVNTSKYL
jgi:hypothetical protein